MKKDRVPLRQMAVGAAYSNYQVRNSLGAERVHGTLYCLITTLAVRGPAEFSSRGKGTSPHRMDLNWDSGGRK